MFISQIEAALTRDRSDPSEPPTVAIRSEARAERVLAALLVWFDQQDRHSQIAVEIGGEPAGYLDREWLVESADPVLRGLGDGDYAILPGDPAWKETGLHCPVPGCPYHLWVVCYDPADQHMCKIHHVLLVEDEA